MLIGREDEQRTLDALLSGARVGRSGVLVLSGEAGIGKSALLSYARDAAEGFRVLTANGTSAEHDLPFSGLGRLLAPLVAAVDDLPEPQAQALGVALALRTGGTVDRFAVSAAAHTLVTRAGESEPVGIVVDDAHLLDTPSAQALAFVARRLLVDSVFVLAAVRPGVSDIWDDLPTRHLPPLDTQAAERLADQAANSGLTPEQRRRVTAICAGNPLAIRALAQEPEGIGDTPFGGVVTVPRVVADAYARRTAGLQEDELRLLRLVVIADGDLQTVAAASAAEGLSLERLGRAEALGILTVSPYRIDFTHPLVASAVYAATPPDVRRRLHTLVADSLAPSEEDRRAWHRSEAALGPDEEVARALDQVGARASGRGAYAVASSAYERAATLSAGTAARARRFLAAGEAAWSAGDDHRAPALLDQAERNAARPVDRARARALAGQVAARGGSLARARDLLMSAAREAGPDAPDEALLMYAAAVDVCFYLLDAAGASAAAEGASVMLATRDGQRPGRAQAVASIAVGMGRIVAGESGADLIRSGLDTLAELPDPTEQESDWAVTGLLYLREAGAAGDLLRETIESRRRSALLGQLPHLLFHLARNDATTDRWSRAESLYSQAVELAREFGQLTELGASLAGLAALHARQGRVEECHRVAEEANRVGAGREVRMVTAWTGFALAELDVSRGEVGAAVTGFTDLAGLLQDLDVGDPDLWPGPELVEVLLRVGMRGRAVEVDAAFQERAVRKGQAWSLARAARASALLAGDDELDERFGEALRWHAAGPDTFERARTLLLYGGRLRRARRRVDARGHLREARAAFDGLGARLWADVASAELQATGVRARARSTGPVLELTARELQVAQLLAEGRTTREAAAALFLSPKTVEYHLRRVYTKLDITSREELRRRLPEVLP